MHTREGCELLESLFVASDPLEDGFEGVLLEIHRHGDRYVLLEVAGATADRLLLRRSSSKDRGLVWAVLAGELWAGCSSEARAPSRAGLGSLLPRPGRSRRPSRASSAPRYRSATQEVCIWWWIPKSSGCGSGKRSGSC
jgi:hypothetical protein